MFLVIRFTSVSPVLATLYDNSKSNFAFISELCFESVGTINFKGIE